jgi:hypothetical protein
MNKTKIIRNSLIYFLLFVGFIFLYVVKFEKILDPNSVGEASSKVNFVYQQF